MGKEMTRQLELPLYNRSTDLGGHSKQVRVAAGHDAELRFTNSERAEQLRGSMRVRPCTTDDLPRLCELAKMLHAESVHSHVPFNATKFTMYIRNVLDAANADAWCVLAVECDTGIVGFFIGYVTTQIYSDIKVSNDCGFFIEQQYRGGFAGKKLLMTYVAWAQSRGVQGIGVSFNSGINVERTAAFLDAIDFQRVGENFKYVGD